MDNKVDTGRVVRRIEEVATLLVTMMTLLTVVVCAVVCDQSSRTRECIKSTQVEQTFDTQALETWCKGEDMGTVRMVGAWLYEVHDGYVTLEDEQGNLWDVDTIVAEDTFLLLWIADNNTADITDDMIVKVWCDWTNQ